MTITRRQFLQTAALTTGGLLLPGVARSDEGGWTRLRAAPAEAMLLDGKPDDPMTAVWAYEGTVPGLPLRFRKGERAKIRLQNGLEQPTSIHWHGLRVPNAMDGVAGLTQAAVEPGDSFDYEFVVPDSGTYWYHSHNRSWEQVARGLYGTLVVEEENPPAVDHDLTLAIDDWRIADDGQIHEDSFGSMMDLSHAGRMGNWLTVNGKSLAKFNVSAGDRLRLRLLNAANARIFDLDLSPAESTLIALDGQPVTPRRLDGPLKLAPGQRADLIVDLTGEPGSRLVLNAVSGGDPVEAAVFEYDQTEGRDRIAGRPEGALEAPQRPPLDHANMVEQGLLMEGGAMGRMESGRFQGQEMTPRELMSFGKIWTFNGVAGDMSDMHDPLLRVERGRSVAIDMFNDTRFPHAMHLHGHHFQVLEIDREPARHQDWMDTVLMFPGERLKIGFVADNPGKWLFHCHMLEHHAAGMGTWLEVGT
ncbi:multicopper oxidase family protein [Limibacillus halophilus]|uniref:FtsP/CotA-like multicopper oxidase with cupredoxin domain n=1 Tax=Limibacillus halophilus TaxID=1579333 RepID=A0A839SYM8_9PROT|nr:multicopper oxidase family protein [Limibacillus halophilus]MBB3066780.1 FtsP/CotA-like multicopper oxidase with cupredoxin domain [Limibacillus halophilus]